MKYLSYIGAGILTLGTIALVLWNRKKING